MPIDAKGNFYDPAVVKKQKAKIAKLLKEKRASERKAEAKKFRAIREKQVAAFKEKLPKIPSK